MAAPQVRPSPDLLADDAHVASLSWKSAPGQEGLVQFITKEHFT